MEQLASAFDNINEDYFSSYYEGQYTWLVETQPMSSNVPSNLMAIRRSYSTHEDPFDEV